MFGGVFQAPDLTGLAVKPGNDTLDGGCTTIIVMNPYPDRHIRISKGQHVASFEEKDLAKFEQEWDVIPCDLTKMGADDFFHGHQQAIWKTYPT